MLSDQTQLVLAIDIKPRIIKIIDPKVIKLKSLMVIKNKIIPIKNTKKDIKLNVSFILI